MATIDVKDAANLTVAIEKPNGNGRAAAAASRPVVLSTEDLAALASSAKQPALGTAGVASADVITIQGIASATPVITGGNVASAAADSGNPVKVGAVYKAALPTFTDGQRADLHVGTRGSLHTELFPPDSAAAISGGANTADAVSTSSQSLNGRMFGYLFNGTNYDRMRGDANGLVVQSALSANFWNYAAASGGISNTTTAVTIKAAAGAGVRNYLKSLQISSEALGAATEIVIRDGASGTVLWREKIGTAGYVNGRTLNFDPPLRGTANTLMEVVTLTASVTGAVFVNAQGYTGV